MICGMWALLCCLAVSDGQKIGDFGWRKSAVLDGEKWRFWMVKNWRFCMAKICSFVPEEADVYHKMMG